VTGDWLVGQFVAPGSAEEINRFQTLKGLFYVTGTAAVLYYLLRRHDRAIERKMQEVQRANSELETQAQELRSVNKELEQFAFAASHDLQEPLRMVISFMKLLEDKYHHLLDHKAHEYIQFAVQGGLRMRQIVIDLLHYSMAGKELGTAREVDLNLALEEVKRLFRKRIESSSVHIVASNLPVIRTYPLALQQVLQHLIGNAIKFGKPNAPNTIEVIAEDGKECYTISVRDQGIGMKPEYVEQVFEVFQRLHPKDAYEGSGLGLSIVRKQVQMMGGKVWASSIYGQGSCFCFTLPKDPLAPKFLLAELRSNCN
jgi:light-regulated signal transduction histidine kinase (bacteriophytochrome)